MLTHALILAGIALLVALLAMTLVWRASVSLRNAGIVDIAWSGLFSLLALLYAILGGGDPVRRIVAASLMIVWSVRLASHLWRRIVGHIETEDGRYAQLREKWAAAADRNMLFFFLFQGLTNVVLSIPILIASLNGAPSLRGIEIVAVVLWFVAVSGESIADAQLKRFKSNPSNRGKVCAEGLWRYSRHPNYFFEWLVWCSFFLFALGSPYGWVSVISPLLMLWFLYKVTGIPATEEQSIRSRGEAYRRYQRTTSPFIPWFPKEER
jgi:steroid 5-alpha reductase family enzyme